MGYSAIQRTKSERANISPKITQNNFPNHTQTKLALPNSTGHNAEHF
jgi:hypothetical protein